MLKHEKKIPDQSEDATMSRDVALSTMYNIV